MIPIFVKSILPVPLILSISPSDKAVVALPKIFGPWGMLDDDDDGTEYISVGEKTTYWFDVVPYQYNGTVKVTCSDPKIATVKYKKDKDGANTVVVKGLKKGTVSITVEVNGAKVTMKLKVVNPDFFE